MKTCVNELTFNKIKSKLYLNDEENNDNNNENIHNCGINGIFNSKSRQHKNYVSIISMYDVGVSLKYSCRRRRLQCIHQDMERRGKMKSVYKERKQSRKESSSFFKLFNVL